MVLLIGELVIVDFGAGQAGNRQETFHLRMEEVACPAITAAQLLVAALLSGQVLLLAVVILAARYCIFQPCAAHQGPAVVLAGFCSLPAQQQWGAVSVPGCRFHQGKLSSI